MRKYIIIILLSICSCSQNMEQAYLQLLSTDPRLNPDSLKLGILIANDVWNKRPWAKEYEHNIFLNYILPPQMADEPVEHYWRTDIPRWTGIEHKGEGLLEFARLINSKIEVDTRHVDWGNDQMGYTATMSGKFGKCDDRSILAVMAMRSMGVPAAFEFIPMWGSGNNGHSFCSVITPKDSVYIFQNRNDNGKYVHYPHKVPKVYRRLFFEDENTITYLNKDREVLPDIFADHRIKDVTAMHSIGVRDISLTVQQSNCNCLCYLAVFHPNGWYPIAYGTMDNGNMSFQDVGTGTDAHGNIPLKGENIGNGILYLPMMYSNGITPIFNPIIVAKDKIRVLKPAKDTESIILTRKYPKLSRIEGFADKMIGGLIEVANKADFSDAQIVHYIESRPLSHIQKIHISDEKSFRYIRYRKPSGVFSIAELQIFDQTGCRIVGNTISCKALAQESGIADVVDKNPLTFFEIPNGINLWTGIDLGKPLKVSAIGFCPRNDDNNISPGDTYELYYWDDRWICLEEKRAESYSLRFNNVPKNSLLWLRNKTKGKEERPFTFDNGTQIWW